jgi:predicted helicase
VESNSLAKANGSINARVQASVLDLYDSQRISGASKLGESISWDTFNNEISQKLEKIKQLKSVSEINRLKKFKIIIPNSSNEWINQGDKLFNKYLLLGTKERNDSQIIFKHYSHGFNTSRDYWCFNFSSIKLKSNIQLLIANYNRGLTNKNDYLNTEKDPKQIKWSSGLESKFKQGIHLKFNESFITKAIYRPFTETLVYFDQNLIDRTGQIPRIFPQNKNVENLIICVTGIGAQEFSCLMSK